VNVSLDHDAIGLTVRRHLAQTGRLLERTIERLSSGLRINRAGDDAAGLAISERMLAQIRGIDAATRNANEAISLAQMAESATSAVGESLQRMLELAVQASNGTLSESDRAALQGEYGDLADEVARLVAGTSYLDTSLLDDAAISTFQVGPGRGDTVDVQDTDLSGIPDTLGSVAGASEANAQAAMTALETAIGQVAAHQAHWGAVLNRFGVIVSGLEAGSTTLVAARGRIVDADYAAETALRARLLILQETGIALLAQANTQPRMVLDLLLN